MGRARGLLRATCRLDEVVAIGGRDFRGAGDGGATSVFGACKKLNVNCGRCGPILCVDLPEQGPILLDGMEAEAKVARIRVAYHDSSICVPSRVK
jgi:hypothetical protein